VIVASWCGKRVNPARIAGREGWAEIDAVRNGEIHEIKSSLILQPGPAALTEGVAQLHDIIARVEAPERASS
jgi:iron complex transport system substrate-binding protein